MYNAVIGQNVFCTMKYLNWGPSNYTEVHFCGHIINGKCTINYTERVGKGGESNYAKEEKATQVCFTFKFCSNILLNRYGAIFLLQKKIYVYRLIYMASHEQLHKFWA